MSRRLIDAWARWCARHPAGHLGYGKNPIATLMAHGIRIGNVHYHDEPDMDDTMQRVDAAIMRLRESAPVVWASLMARHRQVIGGTVRLGEWRDGSMRPYSQTELAEQLADEIGESHWRARQRMADRCREGYRFVGQALDSRAKLIA